MPYGIYPTSSREIINKRHKLVVTFNRCHFGKSPNICVNIIKNLLGGMNRGAEFTLALLLMMQCSQNSNMQGLTPFNKTCFVRACKDFSPVYSGLMCHNRVQSYEPIEIVTCSVIILPVIEVIASDTLHYNHRASKHLKKTISTRYL